MKKITLSIAALAFTSGMALADKAPIVIDPVSGEEMPIYLVDMGALSDEERADVQTQLQALAEEREGEEHRHQNRHGQDRDRETGGGAAGGRS